MFSKIKSPVKGLIGGIMNYDAKTFHCPNCSADLKFSADLQRFTCEYCKDEFTEEELLHYRNRMGEVADSDPNTPMPQQMFTDEQQKEQARFQEETALYSCPSCGAEIISDANTAAAFCYYCHNPVILKGRVDGMYRPSRVIPFGFGKDAAVARFHQWVGTKKFIPKKLRSEAQLEKMTGLYVPFWIASAKTTTHFTATGYQTKSWVSGNRRYTETSKYQVTRDIEVCYKGIPADGSQKIDDDVMEAIEPFDYSKSKEFNMAYLSGFYADKYDVDKNAVYPRIQQRMYANNAEEVMKTVNYSSVRFPKSTSRVDTLDWEYMLLPVWFMTFKYRGKIWEYAINAQTGKITGNLPVSIPKLLTACLSIMAVVTLVIGIGGYLLV